MKPLGPVRWHYWKLQDMARITGVDLAGAMDDGLLVPADWARMVSVCRECDWVRDCGRWLRSCPDASVAPRPCRNRARLALLRIEQEMA